MLHLHHQTPHAVRVVAEVVVYEEEYLVLLVTYMGMR